MNPDDWIRERLGGHVWSRQRDILCAVRDNRRTAVPSCFNSGKSWLAARLAAWWIDVHPPGQAFVVTTARSGVQVKAILWRELHRAHSAGQLPGRLNQTEWWRNVGGNEEIVAFGRKPGDLDPTAFQGIHARYVLVIMDEAAEIPELLFEAADALITNEESRILAIGNPTDGTSHFADVCKPGSGWKVVRIPAKETPNFSGEDVPNYLKPLLLSQIWVEEKRRTWGENNPMWKAKVEAEFPITREDNLIPISLVRDAQLRKLKPIGMNELGLDVGAGGNRSVTAHRRGPVLRIIRRDYNPDTMQTCGNLIADLRTTRAVRAKVDEIGIGRGVVDRAVEQKKPVVGVNVGRESSDVESFVNLRAEGYWLFRERFEKGDIDIEDSPEAEDLVAQLIDIRYKRTSRGQIKIESKDEMRRRGRSSPDDADAGMLSFLDPPEYERKPKGAVWGR